MTTTSSTNATAAAANPFAAYTATAKAAPSGSTADATQDRFMTLLVAQMKNQDPLNPMDNAQVTSQLAQIDTAKGMDKLNQTLEKLLGNSDNSQMLQAAALVGHLVLIPGNTLDLAAAGSGAEMGTGGGFDLKQSAENVTVTITDSSGRVVHRADLGATAAGLHHFTWDGKTDAGVSAQAGAYTFAVSALAGGQSGSVDGLAIAYVEGVTPGAGGGAAGATLQTRTAGAVPMSQVKQIM